MLGQEVVADKLVDGVDLIGVVIAPAWLSVAAGVVVVVSVFLEPCLEALHVCDAVGFKD